MTDIVVIGKEARIIVIRKGAKLGGFVVRSFTEGRSVDRIVLLFLSTP